MTRTQGWFALGAAAAAAVALVFATVGDGVPASEATGGVALVTDHGHTAVWVVLAASLGIAAARGGWNRLSGALAWIALALYAAFLAATFVL
ncbi:hypothetical protein [Demequina silvatica]|uniref:hypothetical protein n=1 Tax=Demequina silvatica TaxID=1638988 RepID=UPI0007830C24|nr:hypothetical protein [Demequina silvatica]